MEDYDEFHQETLTLLKWIGIVIREERIRQGLSRAELAAKSGLSEPEIALVEQGKKNLLFGTQRQVSKGLGISKIELEMRAHRAGNIPL